MPNQVPQPDRLLGKEQTEHILVIKFKIRVNFIVSLVERAAETIDAEKAEPLTV